MLVLTRKDGEEIVVVQDGKVLLTIKVVDIRGDRTRIGVDAPAALGVHRREVWDTIQAEKGTVVGSGESGGAKPVGGLSVGDTYDPDRRPLPPPQPTARRASDSQPTGSSGGIHTAPAGKSTLFSRGGKPRPWS